MNAHGVKIIGFGSYLPKKIVTNTDLEKIVDTSDEWIFTRTGIKQRHLAENNELTSDLVYKAAIDAISNAKIEVDEIDFILVCTNTPDNTFPSTANKLHYFLSKHLKPGHIMPDIPSFDMQAICSGFIYGLEIANSVLKSGKYKTLLLVCADKMSALLDWKDRSTCVLFGDGAGAVVLRHGENNSGIIDTNIYSNGFLWNALYTDGGVGSTGKCGEIKMNGKLIYREACSKMLESANKMLNKNNLNTDDIDYFIPHQANARIIKSMSTDLKIDNSKVVMTIDQHANCSAASIPLALSDLKKKNKLKEGNLILLTSFGAGLTWGSALLQI